MNLFPLRNRDGRPSFLQCVTRALGSNEVAAQRAEPRRLGDRAFYVHDENCRMCRPHRRGSSLADAVPTFRRRHGEMLFHIAPAWMRPVKRNERRIILRHWNWTVSDQVGSAKVARAKHRQLACAKERRFETAVLWFGDFKSPLLVFQLGLRRWIVRSALRCLSSPRKLRGHFVIARGAHDPPSRRVQPRSGGLKPRVLWFGDSNRRSLFFQIRTPT